MPASPLDYRAARTSLGLSHARMAAVLGLGDGRAWRKIEAGDVTPSGATRRLLAILTDPRCPEWIREPPAPPL